MITTLRSNTFGLGILMAASLLLAWITNHYILTVDFYDKGGDYLGGAPAQEQVVYDALQKYLYLSVMLYLLVKLAVTALIIYTALYLADHTISYVRAFNIAIWSEYIFLLTEISKVIWFKVGYPDGTLHDWDKLSVFSLLTIIGEVPPAWHYALQTLNIFEFAYWFFLAYLISRAARIQYEQSFQLVICSYVPALFVWVVIVTFSIILMVPSVA